MYLARMLVGLRGASPPAFVDDDVDDAELLKMAKLMQKVSGLANRGHPQLMDGFVKYTHNQVSASVLQWQSIYVVALHS